MKLRPYQVDVKERVYAEWAAGARVVLLRMDTGAGKTATLASMVSENSGPSCVIAHRDTILAQLSLALARYGIRHNIIASEKTIRIITELHVRKLGRCFYDPGARTTVASVDTIVRRKGLEKWAASVTLWIVDEGHHVVQGNKWSRAIEMFPALSRGLLPTATPERADRKGLGTPEGHNGSGYADVMVDGPPMRWLIEEGWLCDYRVVCADSHVRDHLGSTGASGDWTPEKLRAAAEQTQIVGDVVRTYKTWGEGKTALLFASDIKTAEEMLAAFRAARVRAELVTGETDPTVRQRVFDAAEVRQVDVVLAIDIVSEGTDIPALQVGIMARGTESLQVWRQQFGRLLRPIYAPGFDLETREGRLAAIAASEKPVAIIIDHVGNFLHPALGPPDRPFPWSLADGRNRGAGLSDAIPMRACVNETCAQAYERFYTCCPYCGEPPPPPAERSSPEMVDGDMVLLSDEAMAALRAGVAKVDQPIDEYRMKLAASGLPQAYIWGNAKKHEEKQRRQKALRDIMDLWAGWHYELKGRTDREIQRIFFLTFKVDMLTAQALGPADADALAEKIAIDYAAKWT